ncbi:MAG TPA: hypothetical protein PK867_30120, partial [Pirellulales bacterium]|nr:hypothetical protein [Pirellulales bacterium]
MKRSFAPVLLILSGLTLVEALTGASPRGETASATRGETVFHNLDCRSCHSTKRGEPDGEGPNLAARVLRRERIVVAILDPSREFAPAYKRVALQLSDGTMVEGIEDQQKSDEAILAIVVHGGQRRLISRADVEELQEL